MSLSVELFRDRASSEQVKEHLLRCDALFEPTLSSRVEIDSYVKKIVKNATTIEAWSESTLIGIVAIYCNDFTNFTAYITSVSVLKCWSGKGIARRMLGQCIDQALSKGMRTISLEVASNNMAAVKLYEKMGFVSERPGVPFSTMTLHLKCREKHEPRT